MLVNNILQTKSQNTISMYVYNVLKPVMFATGLNIPGQWSMEKFPYPTKSP